MTKNGVTSRRRHLSSECSPRSCLIAVLDPTRFIVSVGMKTTAIIASLSTQARVRPHVAVSPLLHESPRYWKWEGPRMRLDGFSLPQPNQAESTIRALKSNIGNAIKASGVIPFVPYDLRHTCLTRWARYLDPFTLKKLAGHESLETMMKYIHLNEADSEGRLWEARKKFDSERDGVQGGHTFGHTAEQLDGSELRKPNKMVCARQDSNLRPNDSKSFTLSS
jgi:hypothetical protein